MPTVQLGRITTHHMVCLAKFLGNFPGSERILCTRSGQSNAYLGCHMARRRFARHEPTNDWTWHFSFGFGRRPLNVVTLMPNRGCLSATYQRLSDEPRLVATSLSQGASHKGQLAGRPRCYFPAETPSPRTKSPGPVYVDTHSLLHPTKWSHHTP